MFDAMEIRVPEGELPPEPVCECVQPEYEAYASLPPTHPMCKKFGQRWVKITWRKLDAKPSEVKFTTECPRGAGLLERVHCARCKREVPQSEAPDAMYAAMREIVGRVRVESDAAMMRLLQEMHAGKSEEPLGYQMIQMQDLGIERGTLRGYLERCEQALHEEPLGSDAVKCREHNWREMLKYIRQAEKLRNSWWPSHGAEADNTGHWFAVVEVMNNGRTRAVSVMSVPRDVVVTDAMCQELCGWAYHWRLSYPWRAFVIRRVTNLAEPF